MNFKIKKEDKSNIIFVFFIMLVLGLIFLNSFYWPAPGEYKRKLFIAILFIIGVFILPILAVKTPFVNKFITNLRMNICKIISRVRDNKKKVVICTSSYIVTAVIAYVGTIILDKYIYQCKFKIFDFYVVLAVLLIGVTIYFLKNIVGKNPEVLFVTIVMIVGCLYIVVLPTYPGISWDDETHYNNTLTWSNYINGITYKSDETALREQPNNVYEKTGLKENTDKKFTNALEKSYSNKELGTYFHTTKSWASVSYLPAGIGIIIGRGLSLSYEHVYMIGKFFNLMLYAFLVYFAIKKLKYGKVLLATIALLPTLVFMAANYAYDQWVFGFTVLGYSYFISAFQERNRKISNSELVIMIVTIVIGCLPKAIYFPLLFPLLFLPKEKFASMKQRKIYYGAIILAGLFLMSTFLLPMFIHSPGQGDQRGGGKVNASEQITFILQNPIKYAGILLNFLKEYLSVENSKGYIQDFAYVGIGEYWGVCLVDLFVVAFLDKKGNNVSNIFVKGAVILAAAAIVVLVPTSLYLAFTEVGSSTIAGCQYRYLIPILFPVFYFLGSERISNKMNKTAFAVIPMCIMGYSMIYNLSVLFIRGY